MMGPPSDLDSQSLLPPLLICLPTAFASPKPPPALLPLLSPILQQRVQLLSESPDCKSWLPLLNWDDQEASQLTKVVVSAGFEPHPVSGEIELGYPEPAKYRRLDEETLQALVNLPDAGLAVVYIWSTADGTQAWRVAEVKPIHGNWQRNPTPWSNSIRDAEDAFESKTHGPAIIRNSGGAENREEEDDDDDYWARYDATPGRTPARTPAKYSPAPGIASGLLRHGTNADDSYWDQYAQVQPALDHDDPDERQAQDVGQSSLAGNTLLNTSSDGERSLSTAGRSKSNGDEKGSKPTRSLYTPNGTSTADSGKGFGSRHSPDESFENIAHPRTQSPASSSESSRVVELLEDKVEKGNTAAEFAVQQHISTSLKSLYRLAKGAGLQRREFERIVNNELGVLGMIDDD